MKYLNLFETVSEMENFHPSDEMISYVIEHDKCHVTQMHEICSYTLHLEEPSDAIALFASEANKVTINGKTLSNELMYFMFREGTNFILSGYTEYTDLVNGHVAYQVPTVCRVTVREQEGEEILETDFSDYVDVWFDIHDIYSSAF